MDAKTKAICQSLAQQRDDAVRGYGDIIATLNGELAEARERIAELEARVAPEPAKEGSQ